MQLIKELRIAKGLSVRSLSNRVGISASFLSEIERGTRKPSEKTLEAIATELGSSEDLFLEAGILPKSVRSMLKSKKTYRFICKLATLKKSHRNAFIGMVDQLF